VTAADALEVLRHAARPLDPVVELGKGRRLVIMNVMGVLHRARSRWSGDRLRSCEGEKGGSAAEAGYRGVGTDAGLVEFHPEEAPQHQHGDHADSVAAVPHRLHAGRERHGAVLLEQCEERHAVRERDPAGGVAHQGAGVLEAEAVAEIGLPVDLVPRACVAAGRGGAREAGTASSSVMPVARVTARSGTYAAAGESSRSLFVWWLGETAELQWSAIGEGTDDWSHRHQIVRPPELRGVEA
jgi:hypothetical protein